MKSGKNLWLILASIAFNAVIGGAIYEHMAVVPQWSAAPPLSLSMFQGKYGLSPAIFWQTIHPLTILLFVAALITNWKNERRKRILWPFGIYIIILAITAIYFVPELTFIIRSPYQTTIDADLKSRSDIWETLSLLRLFVLIVLAGILFSSLTKPIVSARSI